MRGVKGWWVRLNRTYTCISDYANMGNAPHHIRWVVGANMPSAHVTYLPCLAEDVHAGVIYRRLRVVAPADRCLEEIHRCDQQNGFPRVGVGADPHVDAWPAGQVAPEGRQSHQVRYTGHGRRFVAGWLVAG